MTSLTQSITCPEVFDRSAGEAALAELPWARGALRDLLIATASCSPYLAGLMTREGAWLETAVEDIEAAAGAVSDRVSEMVTADLAQGLRQEKRRIALLAALADLGGVWPLDKVTQVLTDFADVCVHQSIMNLTADEIDRGKLPGLSDVDKPTAGGMTALAMGKMGAGELNYSSDIDLICFFDETRFEAADEFEARAAFIRVARRMTSLLSDTKAGGYVFRTDLRLRPDASVTPVCISMEAAERYYESVGRTWERAAFIKARPCGGDLGAGDRFLATLKPFVWRKHLDFAAIQDAHDMRLRIRDHKGLSGPIKLPGHDMKLGRGGIREIEFFTQTRQLIAGGRDPSLRTRGTIEGLNRLAAADWISKADKDQLKEHYIFHRTVEHRLQMVRDAQTHNLPSDEEGFARLAAFIGQAPKALMAELKDRLETVYQLTESFFAPNVPAKVSADWGQEITDRWADYPALRTERASQIFERLKPEILSNLQDAAKPEEALSEFDRFLSGLPAGVQLFSLFEANPKLTNLIVEIASTSPALASYLSRHSSVLDAVLAGRFFEPWPSVTSLQKELTAVLAAQPDYEARLSEVRRWAREAHFRIGVHHLRGLIDAETSGRQYADLAEAVLKPLLAMVSEEFETKHGRISNASVAVVAMGSLGAVQLNALSDLDLLVIYDADPDATSDGRRPLQTRVYFARLTQALITALTVPMAEGRLYEVDMRLRPSGRQGPVATSVTAFDDYQRHEAWTWEHLALTRARPVAGDQTLCARVETIRSAVIEEKSSGKALRADVQDMRTRLEDAKATGQAWDMKTGAGRQQDIELFAQSLALRSGSKVRKTLQQIDAGVAGRLISAADAKTLRDAYGLMWQVQAAGRLLAGGILDPDVIGEGGRRFVLRETGFETMDALRIEVEALSELADQIISKGLEA